MKPGKFHRSFLRMLFLILTPHHLTILPPISWCTRHMGELYKLLRKAMTTVLGYTAGPGRPEVIHHLVGQSSKNQSESKISTVQSNIDLLFFIRVLLWNADSPILTMMHLDPGHNFWTERGTLHCHVFSGTVLKWLLSSLFLERLKATENNSAAEIQDQCFALSQCSYTR